MASGFLMAAGVAAAALAGRAILRQARGGQGMGAMFKSFTGAGSVGGAMKGFDPSPMSRAEAAKILGISSSAKKEDVAKVHRKLMILNHPDRGGSPFLAAKVNEAKQVLTGTNQHSNPFR